MNKQHILFIIFFLVRSISFGQGCEVIASFTPGNDSLLSGPFNVTFTNTSTNAKTVAWYVNGWLNSSGNTFQFANNVAGIYEIRLIASNGNCSDTTSSFFFYPGAQPESRSNIKGYYGLAGKNDYTTTFISLKEGGYLIGGYSHIDGHDKPEKGMLIKISESGCIAWSKIIQSGPNTNGRVYKVVQLQDGNYAVSGYNGFQKYLLKLDKEGNFLWSKNYKELGESIGAQRMAPTSDGGLILVGQHWSAGLVVTRINSAGNIKWNRLYQKPSSLNTYYNSMDVIQKGNDVFVTGSVWETVTGSGTDTHSGIIIKISDLTGVTTWTKKYQVDGYRPLVRDIHLYGTRLLVNTTDAFGKESKAHNTFMILDTDGNVTKSTTVSTPDLKYSLGFSTTMPMENGDIYLLNAGTETLNLQPYYAYHSNFIKISANNEVKWSREYGYRGSGRYLYGAVGKDKTFASVGNEWGSLLSTYGSVSDKIQFKKVDSLGGFNEPECGFWMLGVTLAPNNTTSSLFNWTTDSTINLEASDFALPVNTVYTQVRYVCPQEFVDSCNFIKLTGESSVCNLSKTYTFKSHRNKACNQPVVWQVAAGVQIIHQSDTAIKVRFAEAGQYKIAALLPNTCSPIKDSIVVTVTSRTPPLNIGADTSLCLNNTITLHAGTKFVKYKWHNGSTDSVFTVTNPGKFWVTVSDSCDNILSDTINIKAAASVPLSIGGDQIKCNNDTIKLQAPPGFLNYQWSNNYNISSTTSQTVLVSPAVDTAYYLKAEKTPGCFGFDTVKIKVNKSVPIRLGNDTTLCSGQQLVLKAGSGFTSYAWSTGSTASLITVNTAGAYSITATGANGCISKNTIIITTQSTPVFSLGPDTLICDKEKLLLDPKIAGAYTWYDGSVAKQYTITKQGLYWLRISNGFCSYTDSIQVGIKPLPFATLPADTTLCNNKNLLLDVTQPGAVYKWNDGESIPKKNVTKAGVYSVTVSKNGCTNGDTIIIKTLLTPVFNLGKDTTICMDETYKLRAPSVNAEYRWQDNSSSSEMDVKASGTYHLTGSNYCGTFSDTVKVKVQQCECTLTVVNSFSPNNDGINDLFKPGLTCTPSSYQLSIYNRYGILIFETFDATKAWDGKFKGAPLPIGTYYYVIKVKGRYDTAVRIKAGSITILK